MRSWNGCDRSAAEAACSHVPATLAAPSGARCRKGRVFEQVQPAHVRHGHVDCCESRAGHARAPAGAAAHPVIVSMPVGRGFAWRYVEDTYVG